MLARLSIRDIVLIERLDIEFSRGLAVLTGETGAGKSILLDAFALALGGRGDAGLVRHGAEQGQVTAVFDVPKRHPAARHPQRQRPRRYRRDDPAPGAARRRPHPRLHQRPADQRADPEGGRLRAGRNSRPARRARAGRCRDPSRAARCLCRARERMSPRSRSCGTRGAPRNALLDEHRAGMERAAREADYLRHASDELKKLAPQDGEETALAERRTTMMQGEKIAADLREAQDAVSGTHSPVPALSAAVRRLERRAGKSPALVEPAVKAIDAAHQRAGRGRPASRPRRWSRPISIPPNSNASRSGCSRCAPPRANTRRRSTASAALAAQYAADVALIDAGADQLKKLERGGRGSRQALRRGGGQALGGAAKVGGEAQQGGQCRTRAAQARAREIHRPRSIPTPTVAGAAGLRPRRVLGADQSRARGRAR